MTKKYTVLEDFEGEVPRGSGLEKLRGYKLYEERMAVFRGMKPSWRVPPWKKGDGSNEPYMLFYGKMEIWAGATVRLQMKGGRKFTLMRLDVELEDQFKDAAKVITVNIEREGNSLEVSFLNLAGESVAARRHCSIEDKVETLRCYICDQFGLPSVRFFNGSDEIQDGSDIAKFDSLVATENQQSRMIKCLAVSGSNMERKRYEEFSGAQKRRLMDQGIDIADEPETQLKRIRGTLIFSNFQDVEWVDLASENAKVKLSNVEFATEEHMDEVA